MATSDPQSIFDAGENVLATSTDGFPVAIDDPELLFRGDYSREGSDLSISLNGKTIIVTGYFASEQPPSLAAPNGAFLSGHVVEALAGPIAPAQYAQAGALAPDLVKIGQVVKLDGSATSTQTNGTTTELAIGDPVYQGDVVETGANSKLGISFLDESVFSLSENARMVLDELVFDPNDAENSSMTFNLVEGAFVFVTGQVAPNGNMQIQTPVATMGIRGTTPKVFINTALGVTEFTVLPDPGSEHVGSYVLVDPNTGQIIGRVDSADSKWVVTTLSGEAVKIGKSGLDLLEDQVALDELREVVSRALGDRTELDGNASFNQVAFNSSSGTGSNQGDGDDDGTGTGTGGTTTPGGDDDKDDPPIAGDDAFTIDEDTLGIANVIDGSIGGKDVDPDGFAVTVTAVHGTVDGTTAVAPGTGFTQMQLLSGAVLNIKANGSFNYDPNDAYDYLAVGEQATDTFTYTIRDQNGFTDTATVTVTLLGRNDQPEIQIIDVNGEIYENSEVATDPPSGNAGELNDSGSITFTDVDASDRPTASISDVSITGLAQNGSTPLVFTQQQIDAITDAFTILADSGNTNNGTIDWDFTIQESSLDFLGNGEVVTALFTITVDDGRAFLTPIDNNEISTTSQIVTITIYGSTDDEPVISVVGTDSAAETIVETDAGLTTNGTLTVNDVDLNDTASVEVLSVTPTDTTNGLVPDNAALKAMLTLTAGQIAADTGDTNNIAWTFDSGSEAFDYLAVGEHLTLTYVIQATDSQDDKSNLQTVTITVTGTNDDPVISLETGDDVDATLAEAETTITASGSFSVLDVDVTDVVTVKEMTVVTSDNDSGAPSNLTLLSMMTLTPAALGTIIDGSNTTGSVGWAFDSGADQFDYLAVNEQLTLTYTVTVTDDNGAEDTQDITITVTGTNDDPVISLETGDDVDATLAEAETAITASGSFSVLDVDVTDVVTVKEMTVATSDNDSGAPSNGDLLSMMTLTPAALGTIVDGSNTTGSVGWAFDSGADQFDYLAVNEQLTLTYTVTVTDDNGAEDTQDITITVTGTNDEPVITGHQQVTVDFDEIASTGVGVQNLADQHELDGFVFVGYTPGGTSEGEQAIGTMGSGTSASSYPGSAALLNRFSGGYTEFSRADGAPFDLKSIDLSEGNDSQLSGSFTITGTTSSGSTIIETVTKDGTFGFQTVELTGFTDLVSVRIDGQSYQIDNVIADVLDADTGSITELPDGDANENAQTHSATGTIEFSDVDVSDTQTTSFVADANNPSITSANFSLDNLATSTTSTDGSIDWEFTIDDADIDYLAAGETVEFRYAVTVDDGNGGTDKRDVVITVTGTNDEPVISLETGDDVDATLAEAETAITASGSFSVLDVDVTDVVTVKEMTVVTSDNDSGAPSNLALLSMMTLTPAALGTIIDGSNTTGSVGWAFDSGVDQFDYLAVNEQITLTYTVTVTDDNGAEDTQDITITVTGTNDDPVLAAVSGATYNDTSAADTFTATNGTLSGSDVDTTHSLAYSIDGGSADASVTGFDQSLVGTYGKLYVNTTTGDYRFVPDDAAINALSTTDTEDFTFTVTDDQNATDSQTFTVTLNGVNDAPEITAGATLDYHRNDGAVQIDNTITVSDVDSPLLASATVQITQNYVEGDDVLAFVDQTNVTGSFNATTGTMTLTGPASIAEFEAALRLVTFETINDNTISDLDREISYAVNDGTDDSTIATSTVTVSSSSLIVGTSAGETLTGDAFDDVIFGLGGGDTLTGNGGADTFVYQSADLPDIDTVTDYNEGEGDLLDISELLSGAFNPATPYDEISFQSINGGNDTRLVVDGQDAFDLTGIVTSDTLTLIYDDLNNTVQVTVA